jgi:hypothetical protein
VRRTPPMTGQLALDDCLPARPTADPPPRQRPAGTRYHPGLLSDLWGQHLRGGRITTIPLTGRYL